MSLSDCRIRRAAVLFRRTLPGLLCCAVLATAPPAGAAPHDLVEQVRIEQEKARDRRASLTRLTDEERAVNAGLAGTEGSILRLEENLARQEELLHTLAASDGELREKYAVLSLERGRTEKAMAELARTLWELQSRREAVGGRDLPDWHKTDREHSWSRELFASLEKHRAVLAEQSGELDAILERRESLGKEVESRLATLNEEKERLLQIRIDYTQRLRDLRRQRQDTEAELASIVSLVSSLNLQIRQATEKMGIEQAKGTLPQPVNGRVRLKFNEAANPPVRGVTFALAGDDQVQAIHWGKVVFNDIMRGLGRVVILAHGADYYSVYAFLAESPVGVGQDVLRAEPIGKAGFVPALGAPGLYFELRFHQKVINPEQWFSETS